MNRFITLLLLYCIGIMHIQGQTYVPIDSVVWSDHSNGAIVGTTVNGLDWLAAEVGNNVDMEGVFGVVGDKFRIENTEGSEGCPCDFEPTINCGKNDNNIFIPIIPVKGFCIVRVSFTLTSSGNLDCGGSRLEYVTDECPTINGDEWVGTDALTLELRSAEAGAANAIIVCGEDGVGRVERAVDVLDEDEVSMIINVGTQDFGEYYEIGNIRIDGILRDPPIEIEMTTPDQIGPNTICDGNGQPILLQTNELPQSSTYRWQLPDGSNSNQRTLSIDNYDASSSGVYSVTVTNVGGCEVTDDINITVLPSASNDTISATLCASQDTVIEGQLFDFHRPRGVIQRDTGSVMTCPSTLYVDLIFDEPERSIIDTVICQGDFIVIGDMTFTEEIDVMEIWLPLSASDGCDSIVTLSISIQEPIRSTLNPTICPDSTLVFLGIAYDTLNSTGIDTLRSSRGCDSIIYSIDLSFFSHPPVIKLPDTSFCANNAVFYPEYNVTLDANLLSYDTIINTADGCQQTVMFRGSLLSPRDTFFEQTICFGETFPLGDQILTTTRMVTDSIFTPDGCIQRVTLDLTVLEEIREEISQTICQGAEYPLGDQILTSSGIYPEIFRGASAFGCDSTVVLTLTVLQPLEESITVRICPGELYDFNGRLLTEPDIYIDTVQTESNCDSIVILSLELNETVLNEVYDTSCSGLAYPWKDGVLTEGGEYTDSLSTSEGCDSIVILYLHFEEPKTSGIEASICEGETYEFGGRVLTQSGSYDLPLVTPSGCDSIVRLALTVIPTVRNSIRMQFSCGGETVTVGNNSYTTAGIYVDTLEASTGCDSIVTLELIIPNRIFTQVDTVICEGEVFMLGTEMYTESGNYDGRLLSSTGCDSTINVRLDVVGATSENVDVTLCPGENLMVFNNIYGNSMERLVTETEYDTIVGRSSHGCDSIVYLGLTRVAAGPRIVPVTLCSGESFRVGNNVYRTTGMYTDTLQSSYGCDSIVNLDLVVKSPSVTSISPVICTGASFTIGDVVLTDAGFYPISLVSVDGCDSLVNVDLTVGSAFILPQVVTLCAGDGLTVGGVRYDSTGIYRDTFVSSLGCDSIVSLDLTIEETQRITLDTAICSRDILEIGGNRFDQTTMTEVVLRSQRGCDSLIIDLNLLVLNEINTVSNVPICEGQQVSVGTSIYTTPGTYMDTLVAQTGCDSVVRTIITLTEVLTTSIEREICPGGSIMVGSSRYVDTGVYVDTLVSSTTCDSIVTLTLDVVDVVTDELDVTICAGETYAFGSQTLANAGVYVDTLVSEAGCDSIVTLDLEITPDLVIDIDSVFGTCEGRTNGSFIIRDINGAMLPIAVGGIPGVGVIEALPMVVKGLNSQLYNIDIADANGCVASTEVFIAAERNTSLSINSISIDPMGIYDLEVLYSGVIESIAWDNDPGLSCYDCLNPRANIAVATTFRVTITDIDGCPSVAMISLSTNGLGNIFTSNVFNPNSSIGNHRFYIQGEDDSDALYDLFIYDRWGNEVFRVDGAPINDMEYGWDGTLLGRSLNPDVYVYTARIYNSIGAETILRGDLTMMN